MRVGGRGRWCPKVVDLYAHIVGDQASTISIQRFDPQDRLSRGSHVAPNALGEAPDDRVCAITAAIRATRRNIHPRKSEVVLELVDVTQRHRVVNAARVFI